MSTDTKEEDKANASAAVADTGGEAGAEAEAPGAEAVAAVDGPTADAATTAVGSGDAEEEEATKKEIANEDGPCPADAAVPETKSGEAAGETAAAAAAAEDTAAVPEPKQQKQQGNERTWDTTPRKVVIHNVLKFLRPREVDRLIESWLSDATQPTQTPQTQAIRIAKYKKPPRNAWINITLEEESMVEPFLELINGTERLNKRGQRMVARKAGDKDGDDRDRGDSNSRNNKRSRDGDDGGDDDNPNGSPNKRAKPNNSNEPSTPRTVNDVRDKLTPLWQIPYPTQLIQKKRTLIKKCAMSIVRETKSRFRTLEKEAKRNKQQGGGQKGEVPKLYDWCAGRKGIEVKDVLGSPEVVEYRNKCELTFGYRDVEVEDGDGDAETKAEGKAKGEAEGKEEKSNNGSGDVSMEQESDAAEEEAKKPASANKTGDDVSMNEGGDLAACANIDDTTTSESKQPPASKTERIPSVGFLPFGWSADVSLPHPLQNIPSEVCAISDILNTFLATSPLPPYDTKVHRGIWRTVTIRSSVRTGQVMVVVQHAPPEGGAGARDCGSDVYGKELFEKERDRMVEMLTAGGEDGALVLPEGRDLPEVVMVVAEEKEKHGSGDAVAEEDEKMKDGGDVDVEDEEKQSSSSAAAPVAKDETKPPPPLRVTSIFFQEFDGLSTPSPSHPVQHAYGATYIEEILGRCTFQISPGSFFQVTTLGAEVLYGVVADRVREVTKARPNKASTAGGHTSPADTLLLDVCCGTGTIGLYCMKEGVAGRVLGVDISEPAILDARANAARNGYGGRGEGDGEGSNANANGSGSGNGSGNGSSKARFVASRAELVLADELQKERNKNDKSSSIVAVVDPAREGLHPDVVKTIRQNRQIQRLVYVSCNPTGSLVRDAALLCAPPTKKYRGVPFRPTVAQPVDMFPLTPHCEMVMTFDRMVEEGTKEEEKEKEDAARDEEKPPSSSVVEAKHNKEDGNSTEGGGASKDKEGNEKAVEEN